MELELVAEGSGFARDPGKPERAERGDDQSLPRRVPENRRSQRSGCGRAVCVRLGVTFTVPAGGLVTAGFQIVRHSAKEEAPLKALRANGSIISTIAT